MRTTDELVGKIIIVGTGDDLTPFIAVANELVTEKCSDAGYTDDRLEKIETWLASHFFACSLNLQPTSEKAGTVGVNYQGRTDLGLNLTHYGQMAMLIDTAGGLASLNQDIINGAMKTVGISWLGTDDDE